MQDFVRVAVKQHACCASFFGTAADAEHQPLGPSLPADQPCGLCRELHAAGPPLTM